MRQDIHSPKRFRPDDYRAVAYLDNKPPQIFDPATAAIEREIWRAGIFRYFPGWKTGGEDHRSVHQCNHCGAHIRWVVVTEHIPTGKLLAFGEICAAERIGIPIEAFKLRALKTKAQKEAKRAKAEAERTERLEARRREFAEQEAELLEFLQSYSGGDRFFSSLKEGLEEYGSLTPRQADAAKAAIRCHREREEKKASMPPEILPPTGRVQIAGTVVSCKLRETDFGEQWKMLVQVQNGGSYRLWGSCPRSILDAASLRCMTRDYMTTGAYELKGAEVRFTAKVDPKEKGFGFYSRPTKAEVVNWPEAEEATP